jgi:hypothetical protein
MTQAFKWGKSVFFNSITFQTDRLQTSFLKPGGIGSRSLWCWSNGMMFVRSIPESQRYFCQTHVQWLMFLTKVDAYHWF